MQINDAYICDLIDGVKEKQKEREKDGTKKSDDDSHKRMIYKVRNVR